MIPRVNLLAFLDRIQEIQQESQEIQKGSSVPPPQEENSVVDDATESESETQSDDEAHV